MTPRIKPCWPAVEPVICPPSLFSGSFQFLGFKTLLLTWALLVGTTSKRDRLEEKVVQSILKQQTNRWWGKYLLKSKHQLHLTQNLLYEPHHLSSATTNANLNCHKTVEIGDCEFAIEVPLYPKFFAPSVQIACFEPEINSSVCIPFLGEGWGSNNIYYY